MIEINLLPGSAKRSKRRGLPTKLPLPPALQKLKIPKFDRALLLMVAPWVVGLLGIGYLFFGSRAKKADLELQIAAAIQDSARLDATIKSLELMKKRRDTIAHKLNIVQEIDANRYVWAHFLDEAARTLPEHTWLEEINWVLPDSVDKWPKVKIEGRTGNNFALTAYLQQLEASPFIRAVKLNSSELVREDDKLVYAFIVEAIYEPPAPDVIETVPLFAKAADDTTAVDTVPAGPAGPPRTTAPGNVPAPRPAPATPPRRPGQEP